MSKKKVAHDKFRPLRVKFKLRVRLKARTKKEAIGKLRHFLIDWLEAEHESFEDAEGIVSDWVGEHLEKIKFGAENRFWSPRAKKDHVTGYFTWKNPWWAETKKGKKKALKKPWRTPPPGKAGHGEGFPLTFISSPVSFDTVRNVAAGKRVEAYRGPDGRFARKPGGARRRRR